MYNPVVSIKKNSFSSEAWGDIPKHGFLTQRAKTGFLMKLYSDWLNIWKIYEWTNESMVWWKYWGLG